MPIKFSKDLLKTLYKDQKLTSHKIAKKYNCTATWINILRKRYKIKALKPYQRNLHQRLSKRQIEYIYGTLLGDGCLKKPKHCQNAFLSIAQSDKEYIEAQYYIMSRFVNTEIKKYKYRQCKRNDMYYFTTISHPVFTKIYNEIYIKKRKIISSKWLNHFTPFGLAIWYMDDGSITQSNHQMRISTESFGYQEQLLLCQYLKKKWNILTEIKHSSRKGKFLLFFKAEERNKFFKLIEPYLIFNMLYKIYNGEWKEWNWKNWRLSEIEYLRQNYRGRKTKWKELLEVLDHSKSAIMRKASYLDLTSNSINR